MQPSRNDFAQGNVRALIAKLAAPMIMAEMVNALYNIVDRVYIGRMPGVGHLALAGVGISFPIILIVSAFAMLFGMGGAPLTSILRGAGDDGEAEKILGCSLFMLVLSGTVITCLSLALLPQLLTAFGASETILPYAQAYMQLYLAGTMFVMLSLGLNPFINAQGFTRTGMMSVAIGAVLNTALDPIFIFTFGMGVRGAALATLISQAISAAWILRFLCSQKAILRIKRAYVRFDLHRVKRIAGLGLSTFTMRLTECVVQIVCNRTLSSWGGDTYVAVMTVISSIRQMLMLPLNGFVQGFQPVVGYNYGAKQYERVREGIRFTTLSCFCYATLACIVLMLFPGAFIRLFNGSDELLRVGVPAVRIYFCGFAFLFMQMAGQHSFVALGKSKQAVFFSLLRKAFIVAPLTVMLPNFLGVQGVFWAEVISDVVGSSACFVTFMTTVWPTLREA